MKSAFVKVDSSSGRRKWYDNHVGEEFPLLGDLASEKEYRVLSSEGYSNYIHKSDSKIIIKEKYHGDNIVGFPNTIRT